MKATILDQSGSAGDGAIRLVLSITAAPAQETPPPSVRSKEDRKAWVDSAGERRAAQLRAFAGHVAELVPGSVVDIAVPNENPATDAPPVEG